jgi:hypothetical protein
MALVQQPSSYFDQVREVSSEDVLQAAHRTPLFTPLELTVIGLARAEPVRAAREIGLVRRLLGRLFGLPPANSLADERLEELRRFAIIARCRSGAVAKRMPDFLARGFTPLQASALVGGYLA